MNVADVQSNWRGRSVEGGVEEEMLEHGMPLDVVGRTGTSGFLTAHLPTYSENSWKVRCSDGYVEVGHEEPEASQQVHHQLVFG